MKKFFRLICGLLCTAAFAAPSISNAQTYTYSLVYNNGGSGSITFSSLNLSNNLTLNSIPSYISAINLSVGGSNYSLTSTSPINGIYLRAASGTTLTLDPNNTSNIKSLFLDLNFFTSATTTGCPAGLTTPNGVSAFTLRDCGTSTNYLLQSIIFGSGGSSVSAINTQQAVLQNAASLAATFNTQAAALQAGLTYDCNTFDEDGLCASVGGRMTYAASAPFSNQQSGLVIVSHKPSPYFRFGGFADQSVATATPMGIKQSNSGPMFGFFGYWNNQKDGMGLGASVTTSFSNNNLTVSRSNALANTVAGSGATQLQGQGMQGQLTYALQATDGIKAIPYLGVRYYRVATGAYSEGTSSDVTSPLSYNAMSQEVLAAVGGVGTSVFLAENLTGTASVGIQQNMNYKMGNYQGTSSINGLSNFSLQMPSNTNSMATANAGLNYAIKKNEKLGVNVLWQQQAFTATSTVTALATYSIGF